MVPNEVDKPFHYPVQMQGPCIWFCLFLLFPSRIESILKLILGGNNGLKGYLLYTDTRQIPYGGDWVKITLEGLKAGWAWGQRKLWVRRKTVEVAQTQVGLHWHLCFFSVISCEWEVRKGCSHREHGQLGQPLCRSGGRQDWVGLTQTSGDLH